MAVLNPLFERRHYYFLVNCLAPESPLSMANVVADALEKDNSRFDRERFLSAWFAVSKEAINNIPDPIKQRERQIEHDLESLFK
tara:strand:- start:2148 stop:2399 length:252 start_codon:yes stop_codon:yes gene_type:complete